MKKILALLLCVILAAGLFAGCNKNPEPAATPSTTAGTTPGTSAEVSEADMPTVKMFYMLGSVPKDQEMVAAKINEYTMEKIGVKLELTPVPYGAYDAQSKLIVAGQDDYDIMFIMGADLSPLVAKEALMPLDDLLNQYAQESIDKLDVYLQAGTVAGTTYMLPRVNMMASMDGILMRKDLVEKYNIDLNAIKSEKDLTPVFEKVYAGEPGMTMVSSEYVSSTSHTGWYKMAQVDGLGDFIGVLDDPQSLKIVNYAETAEYAETCKLHQQWADSGYISVDMLTSDESQWDQIAAGKLFACHVGWKPGIVQEKSLLSAGVELVGVPLEERPLSTTTQVGSMGWTILNQSKNPEAAMKVMNLLFSDAKFLNLIDWGIEGVHYKVVDGNQIDFADGIDAATSGYYHGWDWAFGYSLLAHVMKPSSPTLREELKEYIESADFSKALGFTFDVTPVKTELTAVANVKMKYENALTCGLMDFDSTIDTYINELKTAGIDKIIAEKQAQIDAWAKANGIQ